MKVGVYFPLPYFDVSRNWGGLELYIERYADASGPVMEHVLFNVIQRACRRRPRIFMAARNWEHTLVRCKSTGEHRTGNSEGVRRRQRRQQRRRRRHQGTVRYTESEITCICVYAYVHVVREQLQAPVYLRRETDISRVDSDKSDVLPVAPSRRVSRFVYHLSGYKGDVIFLQREANSPSLSVPTKPRGIWVSHS